MGKTVIFDPVTKRFAQLDPPDRPHKIKLSEEDEARLIKDFKEVMKREPTEEEVETLMVEERRIRKARGGE